MSIIEDPTFVTSKFQKRKQETMAERGFKEIITENFSNLGKETDSGPESTDSPQKDHTKTHYNLNSKNERWPEKIESNMGK